MVKESASEKGQDPARSLVKKVKILVTQLCLTLYNPVRTVAHQAPLSLEFSRQEYWSGLPCPPPEDLPDSSIEPVSLAFASGLFTTSTTWKALQFGVRTKFMLNLTQDKLHYISI